MFQNYVKLQDLNLQIHKFAFSNQDKQNLSNVIDPSIRLFKTYTERMIAAGRNTIFDIIVNHLDEKYHKRIINEKDQI